MSEEKGKRHRDLCAVMNGEQRKRHRDLCAVTNEEQRKRHRDLCVYGELDQFNAFSTPALGGGKWLASRSGHFATRDNLQYKLQSGRAPQTVWALWKS